MLQLELSERYPISNSDLSKLLKVNKISSVSLTDKKKGSYNFTFVDQISEFSNLLTLHYSVSNHYSKYLKDSIILFKNFLDELLKRNLNKVLLVSGDRKYRITSIELLLALDTFEDKYKQFEIYVAYNPYSLDIVNENERLKLKLSSSLVKGVYLQIGEDTKVLEKGIKYIKSQRKNIAIFGSFLYPTKELMNALEKRPLSGVTLSETYLNNLSYARLISSRILDIYFKHAAHIHIQNYRADFKTIVESLDFYHQIRYDGYNL